MAKKVLVKKIYMNCPICEKSHEVEEYERETNVVIKGETISYIENYYCCTNTLSEECEFQTAEMMNKNLMAARNAYRVKHHLLTSDEIVSIRKYYGLTQVELARLLGWGEATISRYESKAIQDEAHNNVLSLIKVNPMYALEMLEKNEDKFSRERKELIYKQIKNQLYLHGKEYLTRISLESDYVDYLKPSDENGFTLLNINKIEACISYLAEHVDYLFKVKLMKMLWYTDAVSMKYYGHAITGLVYQHNTMGALPVGHYDLVGLDKLNVVEETSPNYNNTMLHFYPIVGIDYSVLDRAEINVLDLVIKKFKSYSSKQIIDYMHDEMAYKSTSKDDIIPFSLAKQIRDF